ncbi:MAG TPA: hypothetical protein VK753_10160 [Xanthomonadaceae bacterium]|jgi:hypothetical protein|nr:hypothetical protein [Xanthomonadaceae bacterium]
MAEHKCECFDVVGFGLINFTSPTPYKVVKGAGGTTEQAVQEAVDDAIEAAMKAGKDMLKKQTCAGPCKRFRFVLPQIWGTRVHFAKNSKVFNVEVSGQWTAYIVCYDPANHTGDDDDSSGGDPGQDSGKPGDAPKKKPGKPKAARKPKG